jgi:hypothetical protein
MSTNTKRKVAYIATIRREGDEYVARDESGSKRAWGAVSMCDPRTPATLARSLFHAEEIGNSRITEGVLGKGAIEVEILDFSEPKPVESAEANTNANNLVSLDIYGHNLEINIDGLDSCRSAACYTNPLLAHCLERVIDDLRKASNELATLTELTKGGE